MTTITPIPAPYLSKDKCFFIVKDMVFVFFEQIVYVKITL